MSFLQYLFDYFCYGINLSYREWRNYKVAEEFHEKKTEKDRLSP
jgi:hypothetical protein